MITGHLQVKKGYYYVVLSYYDKDGNRQRQWVSTGLPEKGNKRRAEAELARIRASFVPPGSDDDGQQSNMLFTDFLKEWLEIHRASIKIATYSSYRSMAYSNIIPYFEKKQIMLKDLTAYDIQGYYTYRLKKVSPSTVIHEHAVIHKALKYAEKAELVPKNVAAQVQRPKKNDFKPVFLNAEELDAVFEAIKDTKVELPVLLAAFYGLRREEVVGLKWSVIDFEKNTITIDHTVTTVNEGNGYYDLEQDSAKNQSSLRTLPLVADFREYFSQKKRAEEFNKRVCGNCYNYEFDGYIFVDEMGDRIKPNYLTTAFPKILEKNNLKKMRFHDLRHSCASLLLANGVTLKEIQDWLGHSDFSTTANIYAHLDYTSKLSSAETMSGALPLPDNKFESKWANA